MKELKVIKLHDDLKLFTNDTKSVLCVEVKTNNIHNMIWNTKDQMYELAFNDNNQLKMIEKQKLINLRLVINQEQLNKMTNYEIIRVYLNKLEVDPNATKPNEDDDFRNFNYNSTNFGSIDTLGGNFDFMIKIHRNIIRNLYEKYLYIDVLDIGIGKCRDVHAYSKYVNRNNIYGVEPNRDFSKFCTIKNIYNETADGIFKHFKMKNFFHKFHTIIFCNSYNFVTDPTVTLQECSEFLHDGGRIIMIYMNNDKVVTEKNKYYEIRKGESDPDLSGGHVLTGRQNFIQVFSEFTLVPPHYENQISEGDIIKAVEIVNGNIEKSKLEIIDKGSLVHRLSSWLSPEAKLFNSMFYYAIVGKPCNNDKILIAYDLNTETLKDYVNYLRKKRNFCNGVNFIDFANVDDLRNNDKINILVVKTFNEFNSSIDKVKNMKKSYEIFVNIQKKDQIMSTTIHKHLIDTFVDDREKILKLNISYSKFGFDMVK